MIFVSVGTHQLGFNRLLTVVDTLIEERTIVEPVIAQIGYSTYRPQSYEAFNFCDEQTFERLVRESHYVISHAGSAVINTVLQHRKRIIVVPRMPKIDKWMDEHQLDTAREYQRQGRILCALDQKELQRAIENVSRFTPKFTRQECSVPTLLQTYLEKTFRGDPGSLTTSLRNSRIESEKEN